MTKRFGLLTAIKGPDLAIYPCELFALLGPSGRTKTAMMWMLARFDTSTEGKIHLDGRDIVSGPPHWRPVNMMFISCAVPSSECLGHLPCGLCRSGPPKAELPARVGEIMRLIRLGKFARRKPDQISGGQRQLVPSPARSGYCLCMNRWPHWTKKLRHDTQFELMDTQERTGTTFVLVPHEQEETMTIQKRRSNGSWPDHVGRNACGYL